MIWDEKRIRTEFERLDKRTGLTGAKLPITFGNAKGTLGMFSQNKQPYFRFSNYWFQNPDWPEELALDVIRHEYAHYMDWELYGNCSHGQTWKACCVKVGDLPVRLYSEERDKYYLNVHRKEKELSRKYDCYKAGQAVRHPKFGEGVITAITGKGITRIAEIEFEKAGGRRISIKWLDENCVSMPINDASAKRKIR